ncbi:MAG: hypothetical protein DMG13_14785 [Acidobacteria bacterium]|nr:MAG: hypothetical protein DMG13_14785 [Acidobacteriota bacterium]
MMRPETFVLLFIIVMICVVTALAQSANVPPAMREVLAANGITDISQYPDYFLNAKVAPETPSQRYIRSGYHINPSAGGLFIFSRDLKLLGELYGWELLTLPDQSIVYRQNEIHFAPTHSVQISVFNPVTRKDKQIYPPKPYQPVRKAFVERVAKVYRERGEAWFNQHNHHMDPERFDSSLVGNVAVDPSRRSISFTVRYGDPDNANDPLPFTQRVVVTCAPIDPVEQLRCRERAR